MQTGHLAICVFCTLCLVVSCSDSKECLAPTIPASRAFAGGGGIQVALVVNNSLGSGTPIAPDLVITSAHVFDHSGPIAAVDGYPMRPFDLRRTIFDRSRDVRDDWVILKSTKDRFKTNTIDPTLTLHAGERVYLAGYSQSLAPHDPAQFGDYLPGVVEGVIADSNCLLPCPDGVVPVRVEHGEYLGMSGGPAAIADDQGNIRVWGIIAKLFHQREILRPWRRYITIWIIRLPEPAAVRAAIADEN